MNYNCPPDINPSKQLTLDAVLLYQNYPQDVDRVTVSHLLDSEFSRHLKLCEAEILLAAGVDFYYAQLPQHALSEINQRAIAHFEKTGFEVEVKTTASKESAPSGPGDANPLDAVVIKTEVYVSWLKATLSAQTRPEFTRRRELEDKFLAAHPPTRQSTGFGKALKLGEATWAGCLDRKYVAEVQRHFRRAYLCLFDRAGTLLHSEPTSLSYGAAFGPDAGDVADWQHRAEQLASRLSRSSPSRHSKPSRPSRGSRPTEPLPGHKNRPKPRRGPGG